MYYRDSDFDIVDQVVAVAKSRGVAPIQIALAWMLNKPWITSPIIGATKMYQLEQAVEALDIPLSPEEMNSLEEPYQPLPILGHR